MKNLSEYINEAESKGAAIGHFNISNLEALHGIYEAVKKLSDEMGEKLPIIIGLSEGEEKFVGRAEAEGMIEAIKKEDGWPMFLNADHHYSFEDVKKSLDAGYDMAIIDAVTKSLNENIEVTKKCVEYAKELSRKERREILIEAELGFIGKSSKLLEEIPEGVSKESMTSPEEAKSFVESTGVDLLAPSVGNVHGMVHGGNPELDPGRIKDIREAAGVPLVLHGGSGISDENFTQAIKAGISVVHINTEIRVAYRDALKKFLNENSDEVAPYRFLKPGVEAIADVVYKRLKLFNNLK